MSTHELLTQIESLPLTERISLVEAILKSIREKVKDPEKQKKAEKHKEEIRRRRKEFKVETFDLGCDVTVDRDEIYADRGL